jgi:hypothetical protein
LIYNAYGIMELMDPLPIFFPIEALTIGNNCSYILISEIVNILYETVIP